MAVHAVQKDGFDAWSRVQPYIVPGAVVTGITFVVNHVWGKVAAVSFLGVVVGVAVSFPHIIKELSEDSFYLNIARHVLIVVLPFFGTYGIYGSIGIATLTALAKDYRLYNMRGQFYEVNSKFEKLSGELKAETKTANERMKEFREKQAEINAKLQALQSVDATALKIDAQLAAIKKKKEELDVILKRHESKSQVRLKNTAEIKNDIATTNKRMDEIMQKFEQLSKDVSEIIAETKNFNSKMLASRA